MPRETYWKLDDSGGELIADGDTKCAVVWLAFTSGGKQFQVSVVGPENMTNHDIINACRATGAKLLQACGADPSPLTGTPLQAGDDFNLSSKVLQ